MFALVFAVAHGAAEPPSLPPPPSLPSVANPPAAVRDDLRIREAMLATYFHGVEGRLALETVGKDGVPALRRLLRDPAFPRRDNVVAFLAHLDRGEATSDLLELLISPPAPLTIPEEDRAVLLVPEALGRIAGRGDGAALRVLLELTSAHPPESWFGATRLTPHPRRHAGDLIEQAVRGLAFATADVARERLEAIAAGGLRPEADGRDLRGVAAAGLSLFDAIREPGSDDDAAGGWPPRSEPTEPVEEFDLSGDPSTGGAGAPPALIELLDTAGSVHDAGITYANHPAVTSPMSNAVLDAELAQASARIGRADFSGDVACCATVSRSGNAQVFGSLGDGLDIIDTSFELNSVLNSKVARAKVVRVINYCGGPVTNVIGCAWVGSAGMALVRVTTPRHEGVLWTHEFGHNAGQAHHPDNRHIMFHSNLGTNNGVSAAECAIFHDPGFHAKITVVVTGPCSDADLDEVHGGVDNCPAVANHDQIDTDGDGIGDACESELDGDGDGISDASDNCPTVANTDQANLDGDGMGDVCDPDDDNDGSLDAADCAPLNAAIHPAAAELGCNGIDENCSGPADDATVDADGDTVPCGSDLNDADPLVCGVDSDSDGCDDCAGGTGPIAATDGPDADGDGICNGGDPDDDNDGSLDGADCAPLNGAIHRGATELGCNGSDENCSGPADDTTVDADGDSIACGSDPNDADPLVCGVDSDSDGCDDCSAGSGPNPATDGVDNDNDGQCNTVDPDDDNDGTVDAADCSPLDAAIHPGATEIGCNGIDENCSGPADDALVDLDGDTAGCATDPNDANPLVCGRDLDADTCDDCTAGAGPDVATDGADHDADGACDAGDPDDDNDGYSDADETTGCVPPSDPANSGSRPADQDSDLQCDTLDPDDDNDGTGDGADCAPLNPAIHPGAAEIGCNGVDENCSGPADDTAVDGDGDTVGCGADPSDVDPQICGLDVDLDVCDDCAAGSGPNAAADGSDADADGACDVGDPDDDNDGTMDGADCAPLDTAIHPGATELGCNGSDENCSGPADDTTVDADGDSVACGSDPNDADPLVCGVDSDSDGCDDCAAGAGPNAVTDGVDNDNDGQCNTVDPDDDNDGTPDASDCAPLDAAIHPGATEIGCNGIDENCTGPADDALVDLDGDTVGCATDPNDANPLVCGRDLDADTCDDCAAGAGPSVENDGLDSDLDGVCNAGDPDDDFDGYSDVDETTNCAPGSNPLDPISRPWDADDDRSCDTLDLDDDNDTVPDTEDCAPFDPAIHPGETEIGCNGVDENCSGPGDDGTVDADGDSQSCALDPDDTNPLLCGLDADTDGCDDCAAGIGPAPSNDGPDAEGDGLCDSGDADDDNDGVPDLGDNCPLTANPAQTDSDADGLGDACDSQEAGVVLMEGSAAGATLGYDLANAGDVNNDGYDDLLLGVPGFTNGQPGEGRAQLHLGGPAGVQTSAVWSWESGQAGAQLGTSVTGAGDVNGDGFDDVVIGAPGASNGEAGEGSALLFLGTSGGLAASPAWSFEGNQTDADLGIAVAGVGDVNGDGFADVVVGADLFDNGSPDEGKVALFLGSAAGLATTPAWTAEGNLAFANLGFAVAGAGDVDGDAYDDVLIGAPSIDQVRLYRGIATGLTASPAWQRTSLQAGSLLGGAVGGAGDVNGDSYDDVLVGAYSHDNGQADEGLVELFLGSAGGLAVSPAWTAEGNQIAAGFGIQVGRAGDLNNDGFAEIVIGAAFDDTGAADAGRAFVYAGSAAGPVATPIWTANGTQPGEYFGDATAGGRFNGGTAGDLAVGAWGHDSGTVDAGAAFVYLNPLSASDLDGDGQAAGSDCNDAAASVWAVPSEVRSLLLAHDSASGITTLNWSVPLNPGGLSVLYDTLRSTSAAGFAAATCLETNDGADVTATDSAAPGSRATFFYLLRAENGCPGGPGTLGTTSSGAPRAGSGCP